MDEEMGMLDALDAALAQVLAGDPPSQAQEAQELAQLLAAARAVQMLAPVEMPTAGQQHGDRQAFLDQVLQLQTSTQPGGLTKRDSFLRRLVASLSTKHTRDKKERRKMVPVLAQLMLVFGLAFGSVGGTVVLAADSLPGSPLYPVKLMAEESRLDMTVDPAAKAELAMVRVQERTQEMVQLALQGEAPETAVMTRLQEQLQQALKLGAELPDEEFVPWMARTQQMTQTQARALAEAGAMAGLEAKTQLQAANGLMNQVRQQVETGIEDPTTLRQQLRLGQAWAAQDAPEDPTAVTSGDRDQNRDGSCLEGDTECVPTGDAHRYGPQAQGAGPDELDPEDSIGTGGSAGGPCQLGDADCVPDGDANRYGQESTEPAAGPGEPGPANGSGTGPANGSGTGGNLDGPCQLGDADCVPDGDANRYGQESAEPAAGPGQPGGNPDALCVLADPNCVCNADGAECVPVGDANMYGPQAEGAGPGEPGGNPEGDGTPAGDENKNQGSQSTPSSGGGGSGSGGSDGDSGRK